MRLNKYVVLHLIIPGEQVWRPQWWEGRLVEEDSQDPNIWFVRCAEATVSNRSIFTLFRGCRGPWLHGAAAGPGVGAALPRHAATLPHLLRQGGQHIPHFLYNNSNHIVNICHGFYTVSSILSTYLTNRMCSGCEGVRESRHLQAGKAAIRRG